MKLVSIIVISHNFEDYIEEALESISNQTYNEIEIIVVDDLSSDSTYNKIIEFSKKDSRMKIFQNKENKGKAKSVNFALKKVKGDFIIQFDGDDIMPLDRIKKQLKFMQNHPEIDMSYGNMILFEKNKKNKTYIGVEFRKSPLEIMKSQMNNESLKNNSTCKILDSKKFIPGTSVMIRKKVFDSGIKMDGKVWFATDYDLWLQIIGAGFKIKKAPVIGLKYRLHPNQMSNNREKDKERRYIFNKLKSGKYFK
jgi:glycosyltransferase involved in cell wall biosynthesis